MAIQKEILTRQSDPAFTQGLREWDSTGALKPESAVVQKSVQSAVGALALGKAGDIVTRAYGPVVRAFILDADAEFGTFVAGKGILVNANDCAAISTQFETVKTLKKGQTGSFLVSGACIVKCNQVANVAAEMKVQDLYGYTAEEATSTTAVCEIEVNGFDDDQPSSKV